MQSSPKMLLVKWVCFLAVLCSINFAFCSTCSANGSGLSPRQESPEKMAAKLKIKLPKRPWHMVNIWWMFAKAETKFKSLSIDVTIDRDIPSSYNLYIAPVGLASINGVKFYGGLQTNIGGWTSKGRNRRTVSAGKGAIFSRWSSNGKPIGLENVHMATGGLCSSSGNEGEFCSVRRPFKWTKGTYTYSIVKGKTQVVNKKTYTWFRCFVRSHKVKTATYMGSLRFEGKEFTHGAMHSAFVEIYETAKIRKSGIPKMSITFGYPLINGQRPPLVRAIAKYPSTGGTASPRCAKTTVNKEKVTVQFGEIVRHAKNARPEFLHLNVK